MPSFDVVSEIDKHELTNAVDQMNREISNRFDFKGSDAKVAQSEQVLNVEADSEFQIRQIEDIVYKKLAGRSIDTRCPAQVRFSTRGDCRHPPRPTRRFEHR